MRLTQETLTLLGRLTMGAITLAILAGVVAFTITSCSEGTL